MKTEERIWYLDVLRIIAMFFVVVIHASAYIKGESFDSYGTEAFYMTVSSCCVPIFVMVSGAVFLDPDRDITIKRYIPINKGKGIISFLSGCSFGVYLIHPFAQSALNKMGLLHLPMSFAMNILVVSIASFVLSVFVAFLLKKIPLVNKYLV